MEDRIIAILEEVRPDIDFSTEKELLSQEVWDSFDIISVIAALTDSFSVEIDLDDVTEENFDSAECIVKMIMQKLN